MIQLEYADPLFMPGGEDECEKGGRRRVGTGEVVHIDEGGVEKAGATAFTATAVRLLPSSTTFTSKEAAIRTAASME